MLVGLVWKMCWHTVSGNYEQRFFWAEAGKWGSVYLKQSQLQSLCYGEIRRKEEALI